MNTICLHASSERLTLYYYGELEGDDRRAFEAHLATCATCAAALAELELVRASLASRAAAAARTGDEWNAFMRRLEAATEEGGGAARGDARGTARSTSHAAQHVARRTWHIAPHVAPLHVARGTWLAPRGTWLVLAATLTLGIALGLVWQRRALTPEHSLVADAAASDAALSAAAARHFERAKLVVLGLAMKDPEHTTAQDWQYERQLAAALLPDTRLFRLSATDRGDARLANLLGDLESVLLQASMATDAGPPDLERIQRVIRRRDLLVRMDLREL